MQITVAGTPGSGKSTASKLLAARFGLRHFSTGDLMRRMAVERGVSFPELTQIARHDGGAVDRALDDENVRLGREEQDFVLDARLGWHFIPTSFKVLLTCPLDVAARRIGAGEHRRDEPSVTAESLAVRLASENERYRTLYGIMTQHDPAHFDFVLDTSVLTPEEVVSRIAEAAGSSSL